MSNSEPSYRVDRTVLVVTSSSSQPKDSTYWITQPPADRLAALEFMRQVMYGYDPATIRLQRTLTVIEQPRR